MQIHRPSADGAAARKRDAGVAQAADERPQRQNRGAHGAHELVGRFGIGNFLRLNGEAGGRQVRSFHPDVHVRQQTPHGDDVAHARNIPQMHGLRRQQRSSHRRQGGILRPADAYSALKATSAFDPETVH